MQPQAPNWPSRTPPQPPWRVASNLLPRNRLVERLGPAGQPGDLRLGQNAVVEIDLIDIAQIEAVVDRRPRPDPRIQTP